MHQYIAACMPSTHYKTNRFYQPQQTKANSNSPATFQRKAINPSTHETTFQAQSGSTNDAQARTCHFDASVIILKPFQV